MPIPVAQAGADQSFAYSATPVTVTLAGAATNTPITSWKWTMLSVPSGSSANIGANQDFTDGEAAVQNPQFDADVPGCYVLQLEAENASGWSFPVLDKADAQTLCFMRTEIFGRDIPGYQAYRYDPYVVATLQGIDADLAAHSSRHEDGGADEISVLGLSGALADPQTPTAHAADHQNGGGDEISVAGLSGLLADDQNPVSHVSDHEPGGSDAMAVDAVVGTGSLRTLGTGSQQACAGDDSRLSDARTPVSHASDHQNGGGDEISVAGLSGLLADDQNPVSHASGHQSGGGDAIKLDDLAAPDDNTNLDATTSAHGLCPKLSGDADDALRGDGSFGPAGSVSPLTTKGDLYGYSTDQTRVPIGPDGSVLMSESGVSAGVAWREPQKSHEQVIDSSTSGTLDTQLDYLVYGGGSLDTPSGYDLLVFRDGVKMTYAATPAASNEYWYNATLNQVRVIGDGSSHRWEVYYRSTAISAYTGSVGGTYGTATFGTATFDG